MQPQALGNTPPSLIVLPRQELVPSFPLPALGSALFQFPLPDSYCVWTLQPAEEGSYLTRLRQAGI